MSEYSQVLFCDQCYQRRSFVFSGSGKTGVCPTCGHTVRDIHVPYLRLVAQLDYKAEISKIVFDEIFAK